MSRTRIVLVCSDHPEDAAALASVKTQLAPLEHEGLLECWDEARIEAGAVKHEEIARAVQAASAAVLIVSPDLLASNVLMHHVVEPLVARAGLGDVLLIPVFWRASLVDRVGIGPRKVRLTQYEGYGSPERTLDARTWSEREREFAKLAEKLAIAAGLRTAESTPRPTSAAGAETAATPAASEREYALSIRLERQGDTLAVGYHVPGVATLETVTRPWADVAHAIEIGQRLDRERRDRIEVLLAAHGEEWGTRLFDLLFGPDTKWGPVLRAVYGAPAGDAQPTPLRTGVRVRIVTDDKALAALPWRLTCWRDRALAAEGWTFVASSEAEPTRNITTTAPANVLVLAPQAAPPRGTPRDPAHVRALREVLTRVWVDEKAPFLRVVHMRRELANALKGQRPHILYVYAHAAPGGDPPALMLDLDSSGGGETTLGLDALAALFAEAGHAPAVVYLDVVSAPLPSKLARALSDTVPLLFWRRLAEPTASTGRMPVEWLQRWLGQADDPVVALHAVAARDGQPNAEMATLGVHATYARWRTDRAAGFVARPKVHLGLDRDKQKALVRKRVVELARSDSRRAMALVAYATPGNSVGELGKQLLEYLVMEAADVAVIEPRQFRFPATRNDLAAGLKHHLRLLLEADEREPDGHLLRRHAPLVVRGQQRPILWLDWGTFGEGSGCQATLSTPQLADWLRFDATHLAQVCPDDMRVVSFLTIECDRTEHDGLSRTLQEQRGEAWARQARFRLTTLEPLGHVNADDLLDFLEDPANSNCPATLHVELAQRIHADTGGAFDATAALLQEGEDGSWYDLAVKLRRKQGATEAPDHESW